MKLKLIEVNRAEGNSPEDQERVGKQFYVEVLQEGRGAVLALVENQAKALFTSTVTKIETNDNTVAFSTRNTSYVFEIIER